jgi:hypothetical protein
MSIILPSSNVSSKNITYLRGSVNLALFAYLFTLDCREQFSFVSAVDI